jgi:putative pyruvate formate lyase activating enzyme
MDLTPLFTTLNESQWQEKLAFFKENYSPCRLCPRQCEVKRAEDKPGVCRALKEVKIASYNLHHGEEPPVSGSRGSGTLFFSGCTLKCLFCQNYPISHLFNGTFYSIEQLSGLMLHLQEQGAHNINLVSPSPYLYHFTAALYQAKQKGLNIPIAYNTSGYERPEIIKMLKGLVDVYMPDLKYIDNGLSRKFSGVNDYFSYAYPTILEMYDQVGELQLDGEGIAQRGMLVRHLILPQQVENSKQMLKCMAESPFKQCHLSLMSQYFPAHKAGKTQGIERRLFPEEYVEVKEYALDLGFDNGWFQDL